ncbi:MAG: Hsp20/alpha crystallin family protein [Polyangia bacterium]
MSQEMTVRDKEEVTRDQSEPTRAGVCYSPAVDIYETEEAITLLADLPGVEKEKLDINVEDGRLTITGAVDEPDEKWEPIWSEYGIGGFTRSFQLGDTIDQSGISASLERGVLKLVLPKADRLRPRQIEVTTG